MVLSEACRRLKIDKGNMNRYIRKRFGSAQAAVDYFVDKRLRPIFPP